MVPSRAKSVNASSGPISPSRKPRKPPDLTGMMTDAADDFSDLQPVDFPQIIATDLPADIVLARLRTLGLRITGSGPWQAICPAHADTFPSLALTETETGKLLVHCWGGCTTETVLDKLGLGLKHLYPSLYALQNGRQRQRRTCGADRQKHSDKIVEPSPAQVAEWKQRLKYWRAPPYAINQLVALLDLPGESIRALAIGYDDEECAWIFPERNDAFQIVGLVRRYADGRKRALTDSMRGLTMPNYDGSEPDGPIYVAEGASDTAAFHSVGVLAFGRASAMGSASERYWLTRLLKRYRDREIIIVGDRDASGVGARGAEQLAVHLRTTLDRPIAWALPAKPFKDIRAQIIARKWNRGLTLKGEMS